MFDFLIEIDNSFSVILCILFLCFLPASKSSIILSIFISTLLFMIELSRVIKLVLAISFFKCSSMRFVISSVKWSARLLFLSISNEIYLLEITLRMIFSFL